MQQRIIDQLIITAGQWRQFGEKQYEQRFNQLLNELQEATNTDRAGAERILLAHLGVTEVAA